MTLARFIWDYDFGVVLIAGIPMIFSGIVGGALNYYEFHHGRLPLVPGLLSRLLIVAINLCLVVITLRFRNRHRVLPKPFMVAETIVAMAVAGVLALSWVDALLHAGMLTLHD